MRRTHQRSGKRRDMAEAGQRRRRTARRRKLFRSSAAARGCGYARQPATTLCIVDNDVKPLDLTKPDVFALHGKDLKTRVVIRVFPLDNSYFAELVVLGAGLGWAEVTLMRSHDLPKTTVRSDDVLAGFELVQDGVTRDWYAVRKVDRQDLGRQHLLKSKKDLIRSSRTMPASGSDTVSQPGGRKRIRDWCPGSEFARRGERVESPPTSIDRPWGQRFCTGKT
jgi:hypothetical protein